MDGAIDKTTFWNLIDAELDGDLETCEALFAILRAHIEVFLHTPFPCDHDCLRDLGSQAHKAISGTRLFGATEMARYFYELEEAARMGHFESARKTHEAIIEAIPVHLMQIGSLIVEAKSRAAEKGYTHA